MTEWEYLRAKADGVHDVFKWLQKLYKEHDALCSFAPTRKDIMVGIEKYKKKLLYEAYEKESGY